MIIIAEVEGAVASGLHADAQQLLQLANTLRCYSDVNVDAGSDVIKSGLPK